MTDKRALLIVNKHSRKGSADIGKGLRTLEQNGISVQIHYPANSEETNALITSNSQEADRIIIAGGDGTISCAAKALIAAGLPVGILPIGTANDLARTLGIPIDFTAAMDVLIKGRIRAIDMGAVNDVLFFNAANIGLGTKVTRRLSKEVKGRLGILSYVHGVWNALKSNHPFRAKICCDGKTINIRSIQIAVGNGRFYGGGMTIKDDAAITDQRLDLYSIKPQKFWKLLSLAPAIRRGQLERQPYVDVVSGREISIYTRKPKLISTDGELTTQTPAKFQVLPGALRIFAP